MILAAPLLCTADDAARISLYSSSRCLERASPSVVAASRPNVGVLLSCEFSNLCFDAARRSWKYFAAQKEKKDEKQNKSKREWSGEGEIATRMLARPSSLISVPAVVPTSPDPWSALVFAEEAATEHSEEEREHAANQMHQARQGKKTHAHQHVDQHTHFFRPEIVAGALPSETVHGADAYVLYEPVDNSNPADVIGKDLLSIFALLDSLDASALFPRMQLLRLGSSAAARNRKLERFLVQLTSHASVSLNEPLAHVRTQLNSTDDGDLHCFPKLFVGSGAWGSDRMDSLPARLFADFRATLLLSLDLSPTFTPMQQRITVLHAEGAGAWTNEAQLHSSLRTAFPLVQIDLLRAEKLEYKSLAAYLASTTVFIALSSAPHSIATIFLPSGAAVVLVDEYPTEAQDPHVMEESATDFGKIETPERTGRVDSNRY
jgi:hypothetical protein